MTALFRSGGSWKSPQTDAIVCPNRQYAEKLHVFSMLHLPPHLDFGAVVPNPESAPGRYRRFWRFFVIAPGRQGSVQQQKE
jgi:hypothetical protein